MLSTQSEPALAVERLSKHFPGQLALNDVSLVVRPGEVHALLGENGSGKSTLIKCVTGIYEPERESRIVIAGQEMAIPYSSADAIRAGCGCTHQDLGLIESLTVAENLAFASGFYRGRLGNIRWREQRRRASAHLKRFGHHISPSALVAELSQAEKTLVAIGRALSTVGSGMGRLLILDEPTAPLPADEIDVLFTAIRQLRREGVGILFVSHQLKEVFEIADRATVLRNGRFVGTHDVDELDEQKLIELIVGRPLDKYYPPVAETEPTETLLSVRGLCGARVKEVSFDVRAGEVVGVAGLLGSGRSELGRLVFGAQARTAGSIQLGGEEVTLTNPTDGIRAGIALIPEDRRRKGSHLSLSVRENVTLVDLQPFQRLGRLMRRSERREVDALLQRFRVRPPDGERRFATLSGGNQQKAILAKWMRLRPRLLILDEPVQGVDVGSRTEIYTLIEEAAQGGAGILMIDSEFEDLCRLCDRVLVLDRGRLVQELTGEHRTVDRILQVVLTGGDT
jgi:ABC-type sugar transport system ATPase subunit